jgi:L-rhamnose mutarotase
VSAKLAETVAFRMRINPAGAQEYRRRHDEIWPKLVAALRKAGVVDYRIFLDEESGSLFAVLTRDGEHGMDGLAAKPVMREWWAMMADLMPIGTDGAPWSRPLNEVFHLAAPEEGSDAPSVTAQEKGAAEGLPRPASLAMEE